MRIQISASCIALSLVALMFLAAFNYYVFFENATNHTALSPYALLFVFIPIAAVSLLNIRQQKSWLLPLCLSVFGLLNVWAFDTLNIMRQYDSWGRAGMPDRPAWSCVQSCAGQ